MLKQLPLTANEKLAHTFTFHGPTCVGCQKFGKAAMLSFQFEEGGSIQDVFLDEGQVAYLVARILTEIPQSKTSVSE